MTKLTNALENWYLNDGDTNDLATALEKFEAGKNVAEDSHTFFHECFDPVLAEPTSLYANDTEAFHAMFDKLSNGLIDLSRDSLLETTEVVDLTREKVLAQIIMDQFFPHALDPSITSYDRIFEGKFTPAYKRSLLDIANHMGPDWVQALYHAAVFMTKVA